MSLVDAKTWVEQNFHPDSRPDLRTVRGWVKDGHISGEVRGSKVLVDAARFREEMPSNWAKKLLKAARSRASSRKIPITITLDQIEALVQRARGRCEVTGIPFDFDGSGSYHRPWVPSLDRIDSAKGYTRDNCRIICAAVNVALGAWGIEVLEKIARALVERGRGSLPRKGGLQC